MSAGRQGRGGAPTVCGLLPPPPPETRTAPFTITRWQPRSRGLHRPCGRLTSHKQDKAQDRGHTPRPSGPAEAPGHQGCVQNRHCPSAAPVPASQWCDQHLPGPGRERRCLGPSDGCPCPNVADCWPARHGETSPSNSSGEQLPSPQCPSRAERDQDPASPGHSPAGATQPRQVCAQERGAAGPRGSCQSPESAASPGPHARLCCGSSLVPKASSEAVDEEAEKDVPRTLGGRLLRAFPASKVGCACQRPPRQPAQASPVTPHNETLLELPALNEDSPAFEEHHRQLGTRLRGQHHGGLLHGPPVMLTPLQSPLLVLPQRLATGSQDSGPLWPPWLCPWPLVPRSAALGSRQGGKAGIAPMLPGPRAAR